MRCLKHVQKTGVRFFMLFVCSTYAAGVDVPSQIKVPEQLGEGLLAGFGYCAPRFKYNAQVWNDLPIPVSAVLRPSTNFMGAKSELIAQMYGTIFKGSLTPGLNYQELVRPYSIEAVTKSDDSLVPGNLLDKHLCSGRLFIDLSAPKEVWQKVYGFGKLGAVDVGVSILDEAATAGSAAFAGAGATTMSVAGGLATGIFQGFSMEMGFLTLLAPFEGLMEFSHFYTYPSPSSSFDVVESDKDTIHYFHTYALHGEPKAENVGNNDLEGGPYAPTPIFDGVFFNNSPTDVKLTFKKLSGIHDRTYNSADTGGTYTITLEPGSFNLLSAGEDEPDAIRSSTELRSFNFTMGTKTLQIPTGTLVKPEGGQALVPKVGLGQEYTIEAKGAQPEEKKVDPLTYTYEVTGSSPDTFFVGIQGFNMGYYNPIGFVNESALSPSDTGASSELAALDAAVKNNTVLAYIKSLEDDGKLAKIRDINPIDCFIWYQSIDQYNQENAPDAKDQTQAEQTIDTHEQIWAVYKTADSVVQKRLMPGTVHAFSIIRPQVAEEKAYLFIFAINASTEGQAKDFLNYATDPQHELPEAILPSEAQAAQTVIPVLHETSYAQLTDTHNTTGYLLLTDTFLPYGGGFSSPRWYKVPPPIHETSNEGLVDTIASLCMADNATQKDYMQAYTNVLQQLPAWFDAFNKNKSSVDTSKITAVTATDTSSATKLKGLIPELTSFLKNNGNQFLFTESTRQTPGAAREFSDVGINQLYQILLGPIGFANPLIRHQAGSNEYLWEITWPESGDMWGELKKMPDELKQFLPHKK